MDVFSAHTKSDSRPSCLHILHQHKKIFAFKMAEYEIVDHYSPFFIRQLRVCC